MKIFLIAFAAAIAVYILFLSARLYRTGHFFRALLISAVSGIAVLFAVNLCSGFTGVSIAVNGWSLGTGAVFGVPGVVGMLLLNIFF